MTTQSFHDQLVRELDRKYAVDSAAEWMEEMAAVLERGAADLRRYRARLLESADSPGKFSAKPVDVVGWAVNEAQNVTRNLRLDMAPTHAVRLAQTEAG